MRKLNVVLALLALSLTLVACSSGGGGSYQMVRVPGGSFQMGNPDTSVGWDGERPVLQRRLPPRSPLANEE